MDYKHLLTFFAVLLTASNQLNAAAIQSAVSATSTLSPAQQSARPVFYVEPDETIYVVKGRPATLTCGAAPAVQINFRCAGRWVHPTNLNNSEDVDAATSVRYLKATIEVTREQLDEQFGEDGYRCECQALNNVPGMQPLMTRSRSTLLTAAYLRKRFEQEPINNRVEAGKTTQLQCSPPIGLPAPEVFWLKDGELVDVVADTNYIISNDYSLIISETRLSDSGNYTCGASNMAGRRLGEPATLTVFLNGGWSTWSSWSECSARCTKGTQRRTRSCNSPAPVNGGSPCQGDTVQKTSCIISCPVDGEWSTWSSWSTCSADCRHHRRRVCDSPAPENGGQHCEGTDLNTGNCTGGHCRLTVISEAQSNNDLALYAGLAVAVVIFLAVVIVTVCVLRRHRLQRHRALSNKQTTRLHVGHVAELHVAPDLTKMATSPGSHHSDSPNSSVTSEHRARDSIISTQKLLPGGVSDPSSCGKLSSSAATGVGTGRRVPAQQGRLALPANIDSEALVWSTVTHAGGRITLPESGVSMTIPEGAVPLGQSADIYLAVSRDDKDRPKLTDVQTMLSAVVVCGPSSVRLQKPVILSFAHCASIKHGGQWTMTLFSSQSNSDEPPNWHPVCTLGHETINTPAYVQLDNNQCHVLTDTLIRYTLTGEPSTLSCRAAKILRLAVFAPRLPLSHDYNLRVYCVEDTQDALEGVMQVERRLGGCLLEKPKQMLFQFGGANLCLSIEDFGLGWRCKQAANYQEIPFRHIWNGTQNGLHCSFALEQVDRSENQLTCDILVCQTGFQSNRQVIRITRNVNEGLHSSVSQYTLHSTAEPSRLNSSVNETGFVTLEHPQQVFRLPTSVKQKLCDVLDPPNNRGNDWRMLAQRIGVDRYINYFATKVSPTEQILDLWEARNRDETSLVDLMNIFRVMGRMDAAVIVEQDLGMPSWI